MIIGAAMLPHPPIAVKEIGKGEERKIQPTLDSFDETARFIAELKPDTIIVSTPHVVMYRDWFNVSKGEEGCGDFGNYRAKSVTFRQPYDTDFVQKLDRLCRKEDFPAGTNYDDDPLLDQGTMVPLYFINQRYTDYQLVRVGLSGYPLAMHYRFGTLLQKIAEESEKRIFFVASGDLSHCQKEEGPYGYKPQGPEYDERVMRDMGSASFGNLLDYEPAFLNAAEECGHRSFTILAGFLDRINVTPRVLNHEATFGVGYGTVLYEINGRDEKRNYLDQYEENKRRHCEEKSEQSDAYVTLAKDAIAEWVRYHKKLSVPEGLPKEMYEERAGAFVSIHEDGDLRGCIGTTEPIRSCIAQEIISNAISACSRDPRFPMVKEEELPYLEINVDILSPAEAIQDKSELDVRRYGVICSAKDGRRGLLLPDLEGVDTVEEQVRIACAKGGISQDEPFFMERFEVIRHV